MELSGNSRSRGSNCGTFSSSVQGNVSRCSKVPSSCATNGVFEPGLQRDSLLFADGGERACVNELADAPAAFT